MNFVSIFDTSSPIRYRSELGSSPYGPSAPRPPNKINIGHFMRDIQGKRKIRIFNACVKAVLLYGCETWLVTKEIQHKIE